MLIKEKRDDEIITEYKALVYKICRRVYNNCATVIDKNMLDVEDFVQWGYIALINAKNTYEESSTVPFINYASTCISNKVKAEYVRQRQVKSYLRFGNTSLDAEVNEHGTLGEVIGTDDIGILNIELSDYLNSLMSKEELQLFIKHYCYGYSMKEISKDYNCTPSCISMRIRAIKKRIKKRLEMN